MVEFRALTCDDDARREALREHPSLHGIDYVEVVTSPEADNQRVLEVHFIPKAEGVDATYPVSDLLDELTDSPSKIVIEGGVRIQHISVVSAKRIRAEEQDYLEVRVDQWGDYSNYTLIIDTSKLDPVYARCEFNFKAGCPNRFDCKPGIVCPPEPRDDPPIDYMAKDYAGFRRALLDFISTSVPDWAERLEADLGVALIELLAYAGDQLSYQQDAVANEFSLKTARQRLSVRRHAQLVDYQMHDGASARAFVHVSVKAEGKLPKGTQILSRIDQPLGSERPPHNSEISHELKSPALSAADVVFETLDEAHLHPDLGHIPIHAWGNRDCCLPRGSTTLDLKTDLTDQLKPGDYLLLEEVRGPETGLDADANPDHRQVVRLLSVEKIEDPLIEQELTRVTWAHADQLRFPLCVSATLTTGGRRGEIEEQISVARGNLVLADHGRTIPNEAHPGPERPDYLSQERAHRIRLENGPLSQRIERSEDNGHMAPAQALFQSDPREAAPQIQATVSPSAEETWEPAPSPYGLLESEPFDPHFAVETDNEGRAWCRFGFRNLGLQPRYDSKITFTYRVGLGRGGNVGAETLVHLVVPEVPPEDGDWPGIDELYNPLPAWGGTDPEPIDQVKAHAPAAMHAEQFRAVTEADYAEAAERHSEVAHAAASFRWTGSWHTVFITVDPVGRTELSSKLRRRLQGWVKSFALAGYDVRVEPPVFVPLDIEVDVCVARAHFRAHVAEALLDALSNRRLPDGTLGFFHPDRFTFGQPLYVSQLYAAIEAVEGVDSAEIKALHRFGRLPNGELEDGVLPVGRLEIVRLDNDPNSPENGTLKLNMLGGK